MRKMMPAVPPRLAFLWKDDRVYIKRLIPSLIVTFALCFTVLFFGPVETVAGSRDSVSFTAAEIAPVMAVFSIIVCIAVSLLLPLIRGRLFDIILSAEFGISVAAYIQGTFLNGSLGAMTGDAVLWHTHKSSLVISTVMWIAVITATVLLRYMSKNIWKACLIFISGAVVLMQLVALVSLVTGGAFSYEKGFQLSKEGITEYSSKKNVLVFVMDRLDYRYIEGVKEKEPDFFKGMQGFTSYTNAISEVGRTEPGINYMLTNDDSMYRIPKDEYFEKSWAKKGLLNGINESGMTADVYTEIDAMFGKGSETNELVRNMERNRDSVKPAAIIKNLTGMSLYRYAPYAVKPFFWYSTENISKGVYNRDNVYVNDQLKYMDMLDEFTTVEDNGQFKFIHFNGSHAPYLLNEKGELDPENSDAVIQTRGSFKLLYEVFDKLKEMGIYDSSSIIVLGDHGFVKSDLEPLKGAVRIGLFYKPPGSAEQPLKESAAPVSFKNIPATIARDSGLEKEKFGKTLDDVKEGDKVTRYYFKTVMGRMHEEQLYIYEIKGDAAKFENWVLKKTKGLKHYFY